MKCVVIGAGRIGCGFAGQLLRASGHEVVFAARTPSVVDHMNRVGCYRIRLEQGKVLQEILVEGVRAVSGVDPEAVAAEIADAGLVITAVGAGQLPQIAPIIAQGVVARMARATTLPPLNVLAFENLHSAGPLLKKLVTQALPAHLAGTPIGFSGALVSRAVSRRLGDPRMDKPLLFVGDPHDRFIVDARTCLQPLPDIRGLVAVDDFEAWARHKLYIFSSGHAICAYLGHLKGYHYIHTAIRDPEIRSIVMAAMAEGQRGLAGRYGDSLAGTDKDLKAIMARFANPVLADSVQRVARDPMRKLGGEDRLVGAALLAELAGVAPEKLAMGAAAALCFEGRAGEPEIERTSPRGPRAVEKTLREVCALDTKRGLGGTIAKLWRHLAPDSRRGSVMLSVADGKWTCRESIAGGAA